jgi:hypothetical protein
MTFYQIISELYCSNNWFSHEIVIIYALKIIQGVSELDRQTFRADSMIKNKHKTLNTYGVKNA